MAGPAKKTAGAKRPAKKATKRKATLSATHKKALAEGRSLSSTIDKYVRAIHVPKRRGRKVTKTALQKRLAEARIRKVEATGLDRVLAAQEIRDCEVRIAAMDSSGQTIDVKELEAGFVKAAKRFSENRGITYGAWRDAGVSAVVLKKAGIARTRG